MSQHHISVDLHILRQNGVVLLALLVSLMLMGIALANYSQSWAAAKQRAMEEELLFIGRAYQKAIESYYIATPGRAKIMPASLNDLVIDNRFPSPLHHLRKLYADPLTPGKPMGQIMQGGVILGVCSLAEGEPFKTSKFDAPFESFEGAKTYADWRFVFYPRGVLPTVPPPVCVPYEPGNLITTR